MALRTPLRAFPDSGTGVNPMFLVRLRHLEKTPGPCTPDDTMGLEGSRAASRFRGTDGGRYSPFEILKEEFPLAARASAK